MILSPHKLLDLETRAVLLDATEILLRTRNVGIAKETGKASSILKERILKNDYSREDAFDTKWREALKTLTS